MCLQPLIITGDLEIRFVGVCAHVYVYHTLLLIVFRLYTFICSSVSFQERYACTFLISGFSHALEVGHTHTLPQHSATLGIVFFYDFVQVIVLWSDHVDSGVVIVLVLGMLYNHDQSVSLEASYLECNAVAVIHHPLFLC